MVGMTYAQEQTSEVHAQTLSLPLICLWNRLIFVTYNITIHKHTDNTISMEVNWTMFHDAVNADFFLEHAGELRIIILRRIKRCKNPYNIHTHPTKPTN